MFARPWPQNNVSICLSAERRILPTYFANIGPITTSTPTFLLIKPLLFHGGDTWIWWRKRKFDEIPANRGATTLCAWVDHDNHLQIMELTCHNWDPSIYDISHEDVAIGNNVEGPTRNIPGDGHPHPVEHGLASIESYIFERLRHWVAKDFIIGFSQCVYEKITLRKIRTNFKHLVLTLIRRYGTQAIEERSFISHHFNFEKGIPDSLSAWILYCIKNGEFIQNVRNMAAIRRGSVQEGYIITSQELCIRRN